MAENISSEQVVSAAESLGRDEFTRADLAEQLDVDRSDFKDGFKEAREAGKLEKVRNDDEGTGVFRLAAQ